MTEYKESGYSSLDKMEDCYSHNMSQIGDALKIYTDWLALQQAYVRFLEDCAKFWKLVPN